MTQRSLVFICLFLFTATAAVAQKPRQTRQPLRFEVATLDANTHRPRSTFILGEPVILRISLTNQGRAARTIAVLPDTTISLKLSANVDFENGPKLDESYVGGTGGAYYRNGMTWWTDRPPRMTTLTPGETASETIADLGDHFVDHPFDEGTYTLTANYNSSLRASVSFRVVLDEAKSIPLLEELVASTSALNVNDTPYIWANATLNFLRLPWISGRITDTEGRPLNEIEIDVTGSQKTNLETRNDGRYRLELLNKQGTYTITPKLYNDDADRYTLEPASRTISIMNGKVTNADFIARKVPVSKNVAAASEGAKVRASSAQNDDFEINDAIDEMRTARGWGSGNGGWNDATPNVFPDWLEVDFGGVQQINRVNVFTLSDDYRKAPDPDLNQKFSLYGITDFDVQYWTGRSWRNVPGGAIRRNRNVWRQIDFPALATNKIRIVVRNGMGGASRITEIEAIQLSDPPEVSRRP